MAALLVGGNLRLVLQGQTDVVKSFEQHGLAEMVHLEREFESLRVGYGLIRKIGRELIAF